jgi:hypothetical protein
MAETFFCVACILCTNSVYSCFLSINLLSASLTLTITVTQDLFLSNPPFHLKNPIQRLLILQKYTFNLHIQYNPNVTS